MHNTETVGYPFRRKEAHYATLSVESLLWHHKDALAARDATASFDSERSCWYQDDAATISKVLRAKGVSA